MTTHHEVPRDRTNSIRRWSACVDALDSPEVVQRLAADMLAALPREARAAQVHRRVLLDAIGCHEPQCLKPPAASGFAADSGYCADHAPDEVAVLRIISGTRPEHLLRSERVEAIRRLAASGHTDREMAVLLGDSTRTVLRLRAAESIAPGVPRPGEWDEPEEAQKTA